MAHFMNWMRGHPSLLVLAVCCAALVLGIRWLYLRFASLFRIRGQYSGTPGGLHYHLTDPDSALAKVLPSIPSQTVGEYGVKALPYVKAGSTVIVSTPLLRPRPIIWVADPKTLKEIGNDRRTFHKRHEDYKVVAFYGPNIVAASEADWKRHRDVAKSAFGESNNILVWQETTRVVLEWLSNVDRTQPLEDGSVPVDAAEIMTQIALLVISGSQFGRKVSFNEDLTNTAPPGFKLSFRSALLTAAHNVLVKLAAPTFLYSLPLLGETTVLNDTKLAYDQLQKHMYAMIEEARALPIGTEDDLPADVFKLLLKSNDEDVHEKVKLSDDELLSNTYVFLLAGYETMAGALGFAVALLALHPDVQKRLQKEVDELWELEQSSGSSESYRVVPKLKYAEAVFRETLRLYPPVLHLPKIVVADTVITASTISAAGKSAPRHTVPVSRGSTVMLDISAAHMLESYWGSDASAFKPERFLDSETYTWPRDAFIPFGVGPRACLGQRSAAVEAVCVLAHIAKNYDILVPPSFSGLSREEQHTRLLSWKCVMNLMPTDAKVVFRKRQN